MDCSLLRESTLDSHGLFSCVPMAPRHIPLNPVSLIYLVPQQTLTTAYASEVCPIQLRGYLTAYVNLCWCCGIFLSSSVVRATLAIASDWSAGTDRRRTEDRHNGRWDAASLR